jgi:hypothetical protein
MESLIKLLAKHVGPMARMILNKELEKRGMNSKTLGRSSLAEVVKALSGQIPEPGAQQAFIDEAAKL